MPCVSSTATCFVCCPGLLPGPQFSPSHLLGTHSITTLSKPPNLADRRLHTSPRAHAHARNPACIPRYHPYPVLLSVLFLSAAQSRPPLSTFLALVTLLQRATSLAPRDHHRTPPAWKEPSPEDQHAQNAISCVLATLLSCRSHPTAIPTQRPTPNTNLDTNTNTGIGFGLGIGVRIGVGIGLASASAIISPLSTSRRSLPSTSTHDDGVFKLHLLLHCIHGASLILALRAPQTIPEKEPATEAPVLGAIFRLSLVKVTILTTLPPAPVT